MRKISLLVFFTSLATFAFTQKVTLNVPYGHAKNIEQIATTSDGKYIASVAYQTAMIWEVASHKKIHEINLNISLTALTISTLSITDKLDKLLVATNAGTYSYNIETGQKILDEGSATSGAAFSKDGNEIYLINYGDLHIYNATTGKEKKYISKCVKDITNDCHFYELDNNRLLILHHYGWSIVNLYSGEVVFRKDLGYGADEKLESYDYCRADGTVIGTTDESIKSFNATSGVISQSKKLPFNAFGCCADGKGNLVVFGNDYKLKQYKTVQLKVSDFSVIKTSIQASAEVPELIFYGTHCLPLPGTSKIVYNNDKQLYLFDAKEGSYVNPFLNKVVDFKKYYYYTNLSQQLLPDNGFAFSTEDNGIREFNMETFKPETYVSGSASAVYSPDGKLVAGIGKKIMLTSRITGKLIKTLSLPAGIDPDVEFFFFNYDNTKLIYSERQKGGISSIDINTGLITKLTTVGVSYYNCSASFDGKYFACIANTLNGAFLKIYNLQTKQFTVNKKSCEQQQIDYCIDNIQFLNDSYYLFASQQKDNVSIYKADDATYISSFHLQHYNKFLVLGGDIKNNIIAVGEVGQFQVGAHNVKLVTLQGKLIREFTADNSNDFLKAAFSKDDKIMFTPTTQKGVQVWDNTNGSLLGTYYFIDKTNEYIFVSPEGLFDGSVEGMKELYFVKNHKTIPLEKLYEQFYTPDLLRRKMNGEKFLPPDVANLHDAPKVSIAYAAVHRNLDVTDDIPTYQNTTGAAEVTVTASAAGDAVDEIRVFHNGKVVTLVTRNLIVDDDKTGTAVKKYTINLLPGLNNIRAISLNTQRTESDPDEIAVIYNNGNVNDIKPIVNNTNGAPIAPVEKNATLHLIVVGINAYQNKSMSLNYALADATSFKEEVEKDAKSIITNIKTYFVTDDIADKTGITNALKQVQQNAKARDVFIFYYAGHGVIGKDKEFYLVPADVSDLKNVQTELESKGIAAKLLQQYAIDIPAQKQLFILDACQSAGAFEAMLSADGNQQKSIAVVARSTGTHWIAASGAQQFSQEFSSLGHGAFTYVLLQALKGEAATNKMITVNGLKNFLQLQVPVLMKKYNGMQQVPASYGFGNDFPVEIITK
jgi:WD40 repeat protein